MKEFHSIIKASPAHTHWERIGMHHHHGIDVPIFSLRSQTSTGIGEYLDLIPLIHWSASVGFDIIQLLPINDPGYDTSPYNALSAFALNPLLISIANLPHLEGHPELIPLLQELSLLNLSRTIRYDEVREKKERFLRTYWKSEYPRISQTNDYKQFVSDRSWLHGYALFKLLKDRFNQSSWMDWPEELRNPSTELIHQLIAQEEASLSYYLFLQFLCYQQMQEVKRVADTKEILLMGDIPILISPDSADVWLYRKIFNTELRAGAPPDMYNQEGQDWGFPLYRWDVMEEDDYAWWQKRLLCASHLYHLYRIDHIVGFFRIWATPPAKSSKEGSFYPEDESTWIEHGKKLMLMMLRHCPMLPIGEDLGIVPDTVRACLKELGICGTKVMRWERTWGKGDQFIPVQDYPEASLTTVSTHDSETLSLWWRDSPSDAKAYCQSKGWYYQPQLASNKRLEILRESHHSASFFHINPLQEYLALFPELIASTPEEERINLPGKILNRNWSYRCIPTVEELMAYTSFNKAIKSLI